MIKIESLKKEYPFGFTLEVDSLTINSGERVALIGPNGSGKSTLLRLLAGVLEPDSGRICRDSGGSAVYQPQSAYCFKKTVAQNIKIGLSDKTDCEKKVAEILKKSELTAFAAKRADKLSGGEKQRMLLARTLVEKHSCLLLDEPLSAVDIARVGFLEDLLCEYCTANASTLIIATHLPRQAVRVANKIIIMNNGKIEESGKTEEVVRNPQTDFGKLFLKQWRLDKC